LEEDPKRLMTKMIFRRSGDESILKKIIESIEKGEWIVFQ
jgi:hypothetical protein